MNFKFIVHQLCEQIGFLALIALQILMHISKNIRFTDSIAYAILMSQVLRSVNHMEKKTSNFSGQIGFVLAAAGSAVGVGNLWRFPYLAAKDGGCRETRM